jgi:DNA-binding response OmpR family regulator
MEEAIVVVDADQDRSRELCTALERQHYRAAALDSLERLKERLKKSDCRVILLDLDSFSVDSRYIRELLRNNSDIAIIALSSRTFHPELKEAMSTQISACLSKPVDVDELFYWLKSICAGEPKPRASPMGKGDRARNL